MRFVILLGLVSLFADATYESARSILGPFLVTLGATGATVGLIAGVGELFNNGLRAFSGYFADRTGKYWTITIVGFAINMAAVPLLGISGNLSTAAMLVFLERTGKSIRNPSRDAMLSSAAALTGRGKGFGLQEALGQVGAVAGPLLIAIALSFGYSYRFIFGLLAVPASLTLIALLASQRRYPNPVRFEAERTLTTERRPLSQTFWLFLIASGLVAAGFMDFHLIAYQLTTQGVRVASIPVLYAVAMLLQAISAFVFGSLFDRRPLRALLIGCLVSCPVAPFIFLLPGVAAITVAMILWGVGMGAQKTIFKAMIARIVPLSQRGTAYGIFWAWFGVAWFLGSAILGQLADASPGSLVSFSVLCQCLGVLIFFVCGRTDAYRGLKAA